MSTINITFYDEIMAGAAERVLAELASDATADVVVRINSPGGSVAEGLAVYNALKLRKPVVYIDGVAASMASLVAMSGEKIIAAENALVMVHMPWAETDGNAEGLRKTADLLDKHAEAMLKAYQRTGLSRDRLLKLLAAETWMDAEEAKALGFVDEVSDALQYAAHAPEAFASYRKTPRSLQMNTSANATGTTASANQHASGNNGITTNLRERNDEILAIAEPFKHRDGVNEITMQALANPSVTVETYRDRVMNALGRDTSPSGSGPEFSSITGRADDFVRAAGDTLAIRAGIPIQKPHPSVRDVQGMSLREIMKACVSRNGKTLDFAGQGVRSVIKAAMSTSDFPAILENALGKSLRGGFEAEPSTFTAWTSQVTVPDFKPQSRVLLGSGPDLLEVPEGGEYEVGSMDEDKSLPYAVGKFGRLVQLTWEAVVNDDLGAFLRMTQALGQAAARAEADKIYNSFAENSGAGPSMQDGKTLFNSAHSNVATSVAKLDADALSAARVLLRRQKAVGGGALNLTPRYLLVAPEQEQAAETLLAAGARSLSQGADNTLVPPWLATLELVVEARLPGDAFYLLTAPSTVDTLERAWLEVDDGPVIEEQDGFVVDSRQYKVRHVFGSRWLDWRGAVKVPIS